MEISDKIIVEIEAIEKSMDGLVDEIITLTIDGQTWIEKSKNSVFLFIHTIFWILQALYPLTRDNPLTLKTLWGGGS